MHFILDMREPQNAHGFSESCRIEIEIELKKNMKKTMNAEQNRHTINQHSISSWFIQIFPTIPWKTMRKSEIDMYENLDTHMSLSISGFNHRPKMQFSKLSLTRGNWIQDFLSPGISWHRYGQHAHIIFEANMHEMTSLDLVEILDFHMSPLPRDSAGSGLIEVRRRFRECL